MGALLVRRTPPSPGCRTRSPSERRLVTMMSRIAERRGRDAALLERVVLVQTREVHALVKVAEALVCGEPFRLARQQIDLL